VRQSVVRRRSVIGAHDRPVWVNPCTNTRVIGGDATGDVFGDARR
jgi:hypothetical protein